MWNCSSFAGPQKQTACWIQLASWVCWLLFRQFKVIVNSSCFLHWCEDSPIGPFFYYMISRGIVHSFFFKGHRVIFQTIIGPQQFFLSLPPTWFVRGVWATSLCCLLFPNSSPRNTFMWFHVKMQISFPVNCTNEGRVEKKKNVYPQSIRS